MTQSYNIGPIGYDPDQYKPLDSDDDVIDVVNVEIDGMVYKMPLLLYNKNIEEGRTKFATRSGELIMITEEEYNQFQDFLKKMLLWQKRNN